VSEEASEWVKGGSVWLSEWVGGWLGECLGEG